MHGPNWPPRIKFKCRLADVKIGFSRAHDTLRVLPGSGGSLNVAWPLYQGRLGTGSLRFYFIDVLVNLYLDLNDFKLRI